MRRAENCAIEQLVSRILFVVITASFLLPNGLSVYASQSRGPVVFRSIVSPFRMDVSINSFRKEFHREGAETITLTFRIDPSDCSIHTTPGGYDYIKVGDLKPSAKPGAPLLPRKTFVVELDRDAQVYGVELVDGLAREAAGEFLMSPAPEPSVWIPGEKGGKQIPDEEIYSLDKPFPGRLVSFYTGRAKATQYVYVSLLPVQYTPNKRKVVVLTEAVINLYYSQSADSPPGKSKVDETVSEEPVLTQRIGLPVGTQSIIICPSAFASAASALQSLHANSVVVYTETIHTNYDDNEAEDPPFDGYAGDFPGKGNITGYDYELAKEIIGFLRDFDEPDSPVKYITIIGDAANVSPSYYYYYNETLSSLWTNDWVPTDYFYASPDYDFSPSFVVGRLPVNDASEASDMVAKIVDWYDNWQTHGDDWFQKACLAGGDAHANHYYCAELNLTYVVNKGFLSGMDLTKCFHTDGTFTKSYIEQALEDADVGLVYFLGHGSGTAIMVDGRDITASDVLRYKQNLEAPLMLTPSCNNGNYDHELIGGKSRDVSFGEAVVKSKAGAIAYVGGSRLNEGDSWPLSFDEYGNVSFDESTMPITYILAIFHYALQRYHEYSNPPLSGQKPPYIVLGDIIFDAISDYLTYNLQDDDLDGRADDPSDEETLFRHVFFGDPALRIPVQATAKKEYTIASCTFQDWTSGEMEYDALGIPVFDSPPLTINATTDSDEVKWKVIDVDADNTLDRIGPTSNKTYPSQQYGAEALYLVCTATQPETASGFGAEYHKENWLFYRIETPEAVKDMYVSDIEVVLQSRGVFKYAVATVTVLSPGLNPDPVPGATVYGVWSGPVSRNGSGVTDASGKAVITSQRAKNAQEAFEFCVTDINLDAFWRYVPELNVETCDSTP